MNKKTLLLGSIVGVAVFAVINAYSYSQIKIYCLDCPVSYGLPFELVEFWLGHTRVLWNGLIADVLICIGAGIILVAVTVSLLRKQRRIHF